MMSGRLTRMRRSSMARPLIIVVTMSFLLASLASVSRVDASSHTSIGSFTICVSVPSKSRNSDILRAVVMHSRTSSGHVSMSTRRRFKIDHCTDDLSRPTVDVVLRHQGPHLFHTSCTLLRRHLESLEHGLRELVFVKRIHHDGIGQLA